MGPIWGIPYLLYQAGRKNDFYPTISDEKLREQFKKADEAINNCKPITQEGEEENGDVFHDQLIYALKG